MTLDQKRLHILLLSVVVFAVTAFLYLSSLHRTPFATRGEGREALVVSAMLESGNYVLPLRNGADIPSKPPMFHWLASGASHLLNQMSEFSIRLPSALLAALGLSFFFAFCAASSGIHVAGLSVLILMSTFEWSRGSSHARVDMCFAVWLSASIMCLYWALNRWRDMGQIHECWIGTSAFCLALAVLTKGPSAFAFAWTIAGLYCLLTTDKPRLKSVFRIPLLPIIEAMLFTITLSGIWYLLAYINGGERFLQITILRENLSRFYHVGGFTPGHEKPFYFGLVNLILGFLPWSLLFPTLGLYLWNKRGEYLGIKHGARLYCLIWVIVFLLVISISSSKRVVYLLPAYPALAYLLALSIYDAYCAARVSRLAEKISAILLGVFSFAALSGLGALLVIRQKGYVFSSIAPLKERAQIQLQSIIWLVDKEPLVFFLAALAAFALTAASLRIWNGKLLAGSCLLGGGMLLSSLIVNHFVLPALVSTSSPKSFMSRVSSIVPKDKPLLQYKHDFYSSVFYSGRNVRFIAESDELNGLGSAFLLVRNEDRDEVLKNSPDAKLLIESTTYAANGRSRLSLLEFPPH